MTFLVLDGGGRRYADLVRAWRAGDRRVVVARHGPDPHRAGDDHTLDLTDRRQVERLVTGLAGPHEIDVVHALGDLPAPADLAGVEQALRTALQPLLHLAGVLGDRWSTTGGSLHVLTVGAADTGSGATPNALVGMPAAGLALSLRHEFPALRVRVTDLAEPVADGDIRAALSRDDDRGMLALRGGRFLERVIEPVPPDATGPVDPAGGTGLPTDGTFVVTGGLGGVGRQVVSALRRHTTAPIALVQRRSPDAGAYAAIEEWARGGPTVAYRADVTDRESLAAALGRLRAELGPVGVVVHTAGVLADGLARTKDGATLEAVLAPKVRGAWLLDELTADDPVRAFVLFSSTVALYGAPGQTDYAAANAFLDAFASYRGARRPGSTQALDWSLWRDTGMARGLTDLVSARRAEIVALEPSDAASAFLAAAGLPDAELVIERRRRPATRYGLLGPVRTAPGAGSGPARPDPAGGDQRAIEIIVESAGRLGVDVGDRPGEDFFTLGLDSGGLLELAAAISAHLGVELYPTALFEFPTPRALAGHLAAEHAAALARVPEPTAPTALSGSARPPAEDPAPREDLVAIVGYDCRMPGARTPEELWSTLMGGAVAYRTVPPGRLPDHAAGQVAGLLDDVAGFDPLPFTIAPKDAALVDPQHRLALECCWHALERAGHTGTRASGTRTGVFLGVMNSEYETEAVRTGIDLKAGTGTSRAMLANAVSYALDLTGPSMSVETACSSSLVAVHLAARALIAGEADLALAGGVNVLASPSVSGAYQAAGLLSPTGYCRPFDRRADGYVRGEGVGVVVLRRLADAVADGDHIHAVIRGSAVGHSGRGNGLGAPHPRGQADVVTAAMSAAGVRPADIGYVETHGTGTALGDPVELRGLVLALGSADTPCLLSSVKGNLGHLESAAGIASLIKAVQCFAYGAVPPIAGLAEPNPLLELDGQRFGLVREPAPWPRGDRPRRAGVSSFGFGGTNCHVVLEEPPDPAPAARDASGPELVLLSARTPAALRQRGTDLAADLADRPATRIDDLAGTLAAGRRHLATRRAVVAASAAELRERLLDGTRGPATGAEPGELVLELGPTPSDVDTTWLAARGEAAARELDRWPPGSGVGACCAVVRWLAAARVPVTHVLARGTGLVAAGALAGVTDLPVGGTVGDDDSALIPWTELTARPRAGVAQPRGGGLTWSDWWGRVTTHPVPEPVEADLRWPSGGDPRVLLEQLGRLYERGVAADWTRIGPLARRIPLPVYPFEHRRFWCLDTPPVTGVPAAPGVRVEVPRWLAADRTRSGERPATPGTVLLLAPEDALAAGLPKLLAEAGQRSVVARPGPEYASVDQDRYTVRMPERADHRRLLGALDVAAGHELAVLFLPAVAAGPAGESAVSRAGRLCAELTAVFGALREVAARDPVTLIVPTVGVAGPGATGPTPTDAALLGLVEVMAQEEPRMRIHACDLDATAPDRLGDLAALVRRPPPDDGAVRASRAGRTLVRRLVTVPTLEVDGFPEPAAWWVTGGLGGLGLTIAGSLPGDGVPIVLTSRRELPDRDEWPRLARDPDSPLAATASRLCDLLREGRELVVLSGDVSAPEEVARMRATVRKRYGPGYGVVHAAGAAGRGARAHRLGAADFRAVFAAKVAGAANLDMHTRPDDVAHFVLVSSLAAVAGGWGLGDYAAANAALDAIGRARQAIGLPAVVVNWTAVRGVGMAASAAVPLPEGISPAEATSVLPLALTGVLPQLVVGRGDAGKPDDPPPAAARPASPDRAARPDHFWRTLAATVGTEPVDVDRRASLAELGLDSRAQLAFLAELERLLGIDLPLELLGEPMPVADLAELVDRHLAEGKT